MANDAKNDPKNYYPRYATNNCADCNDMYYTKWGRVRATNYDLFLPDNNIIAACRNEKGFYPYRDERGLGMSELAEPMDSAIVASGALSLGTTAGTDRSISAEFGGDVPHGLSEYYGVAGGVPASGAIDFSDFYGTASSTTDFRILIVNKGLDNTNIYGGYALCCTMCDICCLFNCCVFPSGCREHGNLAMTQICHSNSCSLMNCDVVDCDPSCWDVIWVTGNSGSLWNIGGNHRGCFQCWADNGVGIVGSWASGSTASSGSHWGLFGQPNLSDLCFLCKYAIVSRKGEINVGCSPYFGAYDMGIGTESTSAACDGLPYDCSTHVIATCFECAPTADNKYFYASCCVQLNPCVTSGCCPSNTWICYGEFGRPPQPYNTGCATLVQYGQRSEDTGRIVHLNMGVSTCYNHGLYAWNATPSGKNIKRLLVNALIWAAKGDPT